MVAPVDMSSLFALDVQGMNRLRLEAKEPDREALEKTAEQFEALFLNMVLKSMREATPQDGVFDNEQTRTFTSMLDQQLSQTLAARGVGLADVLVRQLSSALPPETAAVDALPSLPGQAPAAAPQAGGADMRVREFSRRLLPHAMEASAATGIPAHFMIAQAALETGWGRGEIRGPDGEPSHNLFNIKAGPSWRGRSVEVVTTEYVNGVPEKRVESFRAYDSYADSFRDYARLLTASPRYREVIAQANDAAGFARGLQRAGYATDPDYARKLMGTIQRVAEA